MKHSYPATLFFACFSTAALAQPNLDATNAIPTAGSQVVVTAGENFVWPGAAGPDQTYGFWQDLSGTTRTWYFHDASVSAAAQAIPGVNLLSTDGGTDTTFWRAGANGLELAGEIFSQLVPFTYSNGSLELSLPLSYGDTWTDAFLGSATVSGLAVQRAGTTTGHADGHGMLQVPGGLYPSVLRVHVRKTSQVSSVLLNATTASDHYSFYDGSSPFPVLRLMQDTVVLAGGAPSVEKRTDWIGNSFVAGMNESGSAAVFTAYPNPAHEGVTLNLEGIMANERMVEFFDATGRMVRTERITAETAFIDLKSLTPGVYQLRLSSNGHVLANSRLVVQ
jgi:hypothetical protein